MNEISQNTRPLVSVGIISHNHQSFIEKAIKSVLSQNINFSLELLIIDDASEDDCQKIINSIAAEYPSTITAFINNENIGPINCARKLLSEAKGKYIAWLDADDYWLYNDKLQLQVDFLEKNVDYIGCFHDAHIKSTINKNEQASQSLNKYRYYSQFNSYENDFYPFHLLQRNILPTASLVFRMRDFTYFLNNYKLPLHSFSWAFQLEIIKNGKFRYFNRCWSVYLDHSEGLSKKLSSTDFTLTNINILKQLKKDSYYKRYKNKIFLSIAKEYDCIVYNNGKINRKYAFKSQCNYFKAWWFTGWYYLLSYMKN